MYSLFYFQKYFFSNFVHFNYIIILLNMQILFEKGEKL